MQCHRLLFDLSANCNIVQAFFVTRALPSDDAQGYNAYFLAIFSSSRMPNIKILQKITKSEFKYAWYIIKYKQLNKKKVPKMLAT